MANPNWKKGKSGNPNGRPKVADEFRERARRAVDEHVIDAWINEVQEIDRPVVIQKTGDVVMVKVRGDEWIKSSELLAAYGYGKPAQPLEHSSANGEPVSITVNFVKAKA